MATSIGQNGLVKRRGDLLGEVEAIRARLDRISAALIHLDATILFCDPPFDMTAIRPRKLDTRRSRRSRGSRDRNSRTCLSSSDDGGQYYFGEMLELASNGVPTVRVDMFERDLNLFYVACFGPKRRLALLFTQQLSAAAMGKVQALFGDAVVEGIVI